MKKYSDILILLVLMVAMLSSCGDRSGVVQTTPLRLCSLGNTVPDEVGGVVYVAPRANADPDPNEFVPGTPVDGERPTGVPTFLPYDRLYPLPINKDYTTIGCFLTEDIKNTYNTLAGYFSWESENKWSTTVGIKQGEFFIFGYMPSNASGGTPSVTMRDGSSTWADGCKMLLPSLSTVTPADVCVVVGVLKGSSMDDPITKPSVVQEIKQGVYGYQGEEKDNYVYLLLDHLYTNVNLELSVEESYSELRTIVLKQVRMQSDINSTVDLTVLLGKDSQKPIESISYQNSSGSSRVDAAIYSWVEPEPKKVVSNNAADPTSVPGYFAPGMTTQAFDFEFVYDVYDKHGEDFSDPDPANWQFGNLIRKNCHAVNKWTVPGTSVWNGKSFKVKVGIRPTYLYQLSGYDLDNPVTVLDDTPGVIINPEIYLHDEIMEGADL